MLRKVTQRLAFVHAVLSLVLGIFVLGDVWPLAIVIALPLIAAAVVINEARKGTSRLRACIAVTAAGIIVFWLWITQQWPDGWIGFFVGLILAALELALWRKYVRLRRPFEKPSRKTVERGGAALAVVVLLASVASLIVLANRASNNQFAGPLTDKINGETMEVRYASFDEPLVGDGANIATVPVLNDGKGLVTSWGNLYDRTMALSPESRANVIANADRWNASTRQMYPDKTWMWFPSWNDIQDKLRHLNGEYRVIALVNMDMPDAEATRLIRERHPELPANLPVIRVKGALINSECGNDDCNNTPKPAQQFIDANGMIRAVLTNPIEGKSGNWVANTTAAEFGVGLGSECWNGFLGARALSEEVKQTLTSKAATGNGSTTVVTTTAVITSTTVTPSSSTTTKVTTTTPTGSTTTVTTTTPTSTTTTVTTTTPTRTTTNTTTTNTTTNTTTTNTTTSTTPPLTTSKNPEDDPENQGNNNPGHGGNNDTPDPTPSDPAGGLPPTSYTAPATPEPTTIVRPTEAIPSNQLQPSNEPVPADPTDDTPPCNPEICGGPGVIQDTNPSPHTAEAAPSSQAPVAVEEEAAPPAATHSESAPAVTQPSQQSQAPVAPSPASQEKVSTSSVSAGDIDNTASSHDTNNNGTVALILIAVILVLVGGSIAWIHSRGEKMDHKA